MNSRSPLVVHVINNLSPGGAERQLVELVGRSTLEHRIIEFDSARRRRDAGLLHLGRELRALRPGVIVAWLERPQIAVAAAYHGAAPLVANIRGLPRATSPTRRAVVRAAYARYDRFVANSFASRDATRAFAAPLSLAPFDVIPNGVDAGAEPLPRPPAGDALRIGFIGRDDPAKGFDVLLDALELLRDDPVETVAVGHGVPEAVADRALERIAAHGRCADAWARIGPIDALVVPSRSEGSPNVVIEAFTRGVPVISTSAGGARELVSDGRGSVVTADDPTALAEAIRRARADRDQGLRAAERARAYVVRAHAWPRVVAAYDTLFRRLAAD